MQIDPTVVAVAGALSTVAGLLYRALLQRAEKAEKDAEFWRGKFFGQLGMTDLALDEAERRES